MNALEMKNLCKSYQDFTLDHLNLTLPCGCIMGLVGENGAGKSTTIKLILDMVHRDSGSVKILGRDNRDELSLTKEDVGVVLDEVGLSGCLTAAPGGENYEAYIQRLGQRSVCRLPQKAVAPGEQGFQGFLTWNEDEARVAVAMSHKAKLLISG